MEINSNLFDKGRQNWITSTQNSHKNEGGEPGAEKIFNNSYSIH